MPTFGWRSARQGVVAPGLPLGTIKPRKCQGGESARCAGESDPAWAVSLAAGPAAARAANACAGDASDAALPLPRLPELPNAKGSVPIPGIPGIPGIAIPGDDASLEASAESCLLYTSPSPRDATLSRMPSSA